MCKASQYMSQTLQVNKTWNETERNTLSIFKNIYTCSNGTEWKQNKWGGGGGGLWWKLGNEFSISLSVV